MTEQEYILQIIKFKDMLNPEAYALFILIANKLGEDHRASMIHKLASAKRSMSDFLKYSEDQHLLKTDAIRTLEKMSTDLKIQFQKLVQKDEITESQNKEETLEELINTI